MVLRLENPVLNRLRCSWNVSLHSGQSDCCGDNSDKGLGVHTSRSFLAHLSEVEGEKVCVCFQPQANVVVPQPPPVSPFNRAHRAAPSAKPRRASQQGGANVSSLSARTMEAAWRGTPAVQKHFSVGTNAQRSDARVRRGRCGRINVIRVTDRVNYAQLHTTEFHAERRTFRTL